MLRVTIDMVPRGEEARAHTIGIVEIANDGRGSRTRGNYMVRLAKRGQPTQTWRQGAVTDFPRQTKGPYDLLLHALVATVGTRNRRLIEELEEELSRAEAAAASPPITAREDQRIETPSEA